MKESYGAQPGRKVSSLQTLTNALSASHAALDTWRRIMVAVGAGWRAREQGTDADLWYLRAIARGRADPLEASERRFAELVEAHPTAFHAVEEHGSILDRMGQREAAVAEYELARKARHSIRRGMPDRPFFMRHCSTSVAEVDGYTRVLRADASKKGVFVHVARGHAYLAMRYPRLALIDYDMALRLAPSEAGLLVARGEALAALGRHREALQALDQAIAARRQDADALGSRAVVRLALGRVAEADADWTRQLELLPRERHEARACVALRLANYDMALTELERAIERKPGDPYLRLYFLTSLRRLGRSVPSVIAPMDAWPGPLIALHHGNLGTHEVLQRADNEERRAEALFQCGVLAYDHDRAEAGRLWKQAAETAAPDTVEHAAARHELEKFRPDPQPVSVMRATERETTIMAASK